MTGRPVAPPPYVSPEQLPGPCFVLCPKAWRKGERKVLRVLLPKVAAVKSPKPVIYRPATVPGETREVVTWPKGRPWDWRIEVVPVMRPEPIWHTRARALKSRGISIRQIMAELGLVNRQALDRVLAQAKLSP